MVVNTPLTWLPKAIRTEMATTEMKARIKAYSTRVWPFLLFIRRSAFLARIITLLIIVFHLPSIRNSLNLEIFIALYRSASAGISFTLGSFRMPIEKWAKDYLFKIQ